MLNKVTLIGNLGRDPEEKTSTNGSRIVRFSLATSERWTGKDGQKQERTEWHRITVFNEKLCELAMRYLKKGARIYVEGQLQTSKYTGADGVERASTDIVLKQYAGEIRFLGGDTNAGSGQAGAVRDIPGSASAAAAAPPAVEPPDADPDYIPF